MSEKDAPTEEKPMEGPEVPMKDAMMYWHERALKAEIEASNWRILHTLVKEANQEKGLRLFAANEENARLTALLNTPEIHKFIEAVNLEAAHQRERWPNDIRQAPPHFIMVITKLVGKMSVDIWDGDKDKFKHHCIALAAEMANLHKYTEEDTEVKQWFDAALHGSPTTTNNNTEV